MAAYAAAVSLMYTIDLLKKHPSPPISLDKQQLHSLTEIVALLQKFLERYVSPFSYSDEADPLEIRIAEAAYAAEDVIESYTVDNIHLAAASTTQDDDDDDEVMESYIVDSIQLAAAAAHQEDEQIRYINFYGGLQKVIEAMYLIKKEAMEMEMEKGGQPRNVSVVDAGLTSSSIERKSEMVGFDDVRLELLDKLTGGVSHRQIIPIVGMGGIGKTTLARNIFGDQLITEHFDICLWATIFQDYNIEQILREVLSRGREDPRGQSVGELGEELHKYLFGRRYLVVLDDLWSIEAWDKMRSFFSDSNKSRIIVTTRMSRLAAHLTNSNNSLRVSFLNEVDSWTLFSYTLVGEGSVLDLELGLREIREKIVAKCKGLPLSIVVIGGLLTKSERELEFWEYIEGNLSSIVNLENEEYCLRVLKLNYNHLPAHLKPCFLYMGMFDEDSDIEISTIIKLWVSEGFIKPSKKKKNLELVAREYLEELVDRNLVVAYEFVRHTRWQLDDIELGSIGMNNFCRVHDLVRDLSLREAQKQRFYYVHSKHNPPQDMSSHSCSSVLHDDLGLKPSPKSRSYACLDPYADEFPDSRLLRAQHTTYRGYGSTFNKYEHKDVFGLVNSRLLAIDVMSNIGDMLHSSISRLWSLHTLLVNSEVDVEGPVEFWSMHQLKHVEFTRGRLHLQLPPNNDVVILENLHTLVGMNNFHLNEDVVRRMPNLIIFDVRYTEEMELVVHSLSYLQRLTKLESFRYSIKFHRNCNVNLDMQTICFSQSLKQIIFIDKCFPNKIELEDVLQKIGRLPFLEELGVQYCFFRNHNWETSEGQFPRLRRLELDSCGSLENWTVSESSHFPRLEKLILDSLDVLEEIPSAIGEIATLKLIRLRACSKSIVLSAKKIVEEQEELHGEEQLSFHVLVVHIDSDTKLELGSWASPNFEVKPHLF